MDEGGVQLCPRTTSGHKGQEKVASEVGARPPANKLGVVLSEPGVVHCTNHCFTDRCVMEVIV